MISKINLLRLCCLLALLNPFCMMGQNKTFTLHDLIPGGKTQYRFIPQNCGDYNGVGTHLFIPKATA